MRTQQLVVHYADRAVRHPFNNNLMRGTLARRAFDLFVSQDAQYLRHFGDVVLKTATREPAHAALLHRIHNDVVLYERDMLQSYKPRVMPLMASVQRYVDHLHAASECGRGISALAPCFLLYAHVGRHYEDRVRGDDSAAHPYTAWLDTYGDGAFQRTAAQIRALLDDSFDADAFVTSAELEFVFWDQVLDEPDL